MNNEDAAATFRAIVRASPGVLGTTPLHDVHRQPSVSLHAASSYDRIELQDGTDCEDTFTIGLPAVRRYAPPWGTVCAYLTFLSHFPDRHIVRKHGMACAAKVMQRAVIIASKFDASDDRAERTLERVAFDAELKREHINPGTNADLTVASVFAAR